MKELSKTDLHHSVRKLFAEQNTMTLATTDGSASWAAPVYFVNLDFDVYFFSSPDSEHIIQSQVVRRAAAAIHARAETWKDIRGVQMSGTIELPASGFDAAAILALYLKKFSFVKDFFQRRRELCLKAFSERFNVCLYRFRPIRILYLDNRIEFGFRVEVPL